MDDTELMEEIHSELEERSARFSKIGTGLLMLAIVGLWCASQAIVP